MNQTAVSGGLERGSLPVSECSRSEAAAMDLTGLFSDKVSFDIFTSAALTGRNRRQ
jgi:hypothetical protein